MHGDTRFTTAVFDSSVLRVAFPELSQKANCSDVALITLFDVLCWQIRLRLLDEHSIYRMNMPVYDAEDNRYRILANERGSISSVARISFRCWNVNRRGYGDLAETDRGQLTDRGVCPPERLLMIGAIVIEGDEPYAGVIRERFLAFLRREMDQADLLKLMKRFARERLMRQSHPWLALDPSVAEFYSIEAPQKKE